MNHPFFSVISNCSDSARHTTGNCQYSGQSGFDIPVLTPEEFLQAK